MLDSFAGGGTTGVAAYKKGRHCISIEKETDFIAMIKERQTKAARKGK
ncbi:MAG: DNA methyltransferase [bacterium]